MPVDVIAWVAAALILLIGGVLGMLTRRDRLWLPLAALAAGLIGILVGLGWQAWTTDLWPGQGAADALALLAAGALAVTAWSAPRWAEPADAPIGGRSVAFGCALMGAAGLAGGAAALAWRGMLPVAEPQARAWLCGLRILLASVGLGGWLPVLVGSAWGLWLAGRRGEFPSPAADRGRGAALFCYPWLTAALLVGLLLNLTARATAIAISPGELWPLVVWLLGATYLHATSSWRPRRVAAWLATGLAALALTAAVMAAISV